MSKEFDDAVKAITDELDELEQHNFVDAHFNKMLEFMRAVATALQHVKDE